MKKLNHQIKRRPTHNAYPNYGSTNEEDFWSGKLAKSITNDEIYVKAEWVEKGGYFDIIDDKIAVRDTRSHEGPLWGGGFAFIFFVIMAGGQISILLDGENLDAFMTVSAVIALLIIIFFIRYYYTMPSKEFIWNREDGLLTFPGFLWNENITMPISEVAFVVAGPSSHGTGGFELQIARPTGKTTYYRCSTGHTCYEDLSFLLWYMDKNRPLPPGTAFDPYRQKDFDRRKAEGFPNPLFPARFETPEATPKQQAERKQIGGW